MPNYDYSAIEAKWHKYWEENKTFATDVWDFSKPKYYVLDMFPYPSGVGLHAGHPEGYTATDIMSRMKRMQGYNAQRFRWQLSLRRSSNRGVRPPW